MSRVWIRRGSRSAHWPPPRKDRAPPFSRTMIRSASKGWMLTGSETTIERPAAIGRPAAGSAARSKVRGAAPPQPPRKAASSAAAAMWDERTIRMT